MTDLNPTNQGGAWWNFDTYITPIPQFYIRNAFPTPRPELDRRVDPRYWQLRIHAFNTFLQQFNNFLGRTAT